LQPHNPGMLQAIWRSPGPKSSEKSGGGAFWRYTTTKVSPRCCRSRLETRSSPLHFFLKAGLCRGHGLFLAPDLKEGREVVAESREPAAAHVEGLFALAERLAQVESRAEEGLLSRVDSHAPVRLADRADARQGRFVLAFVEPVGVVVVSEG
jgi:hypothetical protein